MTETNSNRNKEEGGTTGTTSAGKGSSNSSSNKGAGNGTSSIGNYQRKPNPTQELSQKVCQKYGWSARFEKEPISNNNNNNNNKEEEETTTTTTTTTTDTITTDAAYWVCYVTVGLKDTRRFVSDDNTSDETTLEGKKQGIASASKAALDGLKDELIIQESKPKMELTQVFPLYGSTTTMTDEEENEEEEKEEDDNENSTTKKNHKKNQAKKKNTKQQQKQKPRFLIKGSSQQNWDKYIWGPISRQRNNNKKKGEVGEQSKFVVGIDTEGNHGSPPVLVQIATNECVLLEITSMNRNGNGNSNNPQPPPQISNNLRRLLQNDDIIKVFCDNYAHHDKRSLGLLSTSPPTTVDTTSNNNNNQLFDGRNGSGSIVDLEVLVSKPDLLGPTKVARGLSRIVTLVMPELNVLIGKPSGTNKNKRFKDIGRFTLIEQGKLPPLQSLRDLSRKEQIYAAMDAWATLQAYQRIQQQQQQQQQPPGGTGDS